MANKIKYQINVQMMDNAVTKDNPDDKIFTVISNGTADKERLIAEMMKVNPGLEEETLRHVLDLENRVTIDLLMKGMRVNNGLYDVALQCKGVVQGTAWDPNVNTLYANFTQGKEVRETIAGATINVLGEKGATMYFSSSEDAATGAKEFHATAGSNFILTGKNIKVVGDDPSVGITLTSSEDTETKITGGAIGVNQPSKLVFFIPAGLADGDYTLTVTTQFGGNTKSLLSTPRSVSHVLHIGEASEEEEERPGGL